MKIRLRTVTFLRDEAQQDYGMASGPEGAVEICRSILKTLDADREHAIVLTLNIRNRVTGFKVCHTGSGDRSVMAPEVIFRDALALGAARIIFAHNHPSGDPSPSAEDVESTRRLKRAGEIVGIPLLDGLVIGHESAVSMRERGLI
jgi:DNA repair protein RadC